MNYPRLLLATLGGFVAYFAFGFLVFTTPGMRREYGRYSAIYRSESGIRRVMPFGMLAILVAMFALSVLFAMVYRGISPLGEGVHFGALIGVFAVGAFVVHNWVNLNIGGRLTAYQAVAYFVEWLVVGAVFGLIYRR